MLPEKLKPFKPTLKQWFGSVFITVAGIVVIGAMFRVLESLLGG